MTLEPRSSFLSLRKYVSHLLSTPTICPSKMNARALSYIGPKLWNSLPPYIRSIKSYTTFMKYIQQLISVILIMFDIIILLINFRTVYLYTVSLSTPTEMTSTVVPEH